MNKCILLGRLTKDVELRQTPQGKAVCSFTIAVDRKYKKDGEITADFINCVAWDKTAELISKWFGKGNMIAVDGRLQVRSYEKDGKKQFATDVLIEEAHFCGNKQKAPETGLDGFTFAENDGDLPF